MWDPVQVWSWQLVYPLFAGKQHRYHSVHLFHVPFATFTMQRFCGQCKATFVCLLPIRFSGFLWDSWGLCYPGLICSSVLVFSPTLYVFQAERSQVLHCCLASQDWCCCQSNHGCCRRTLLKSPSYLPFCQHIFCKFKSAFMIRLCYGVWFPVRIMSN